MPTDPYDQPLDALREQTIDRLIVNYGHGRLSQEALERRLDQALDATGHATLIELCSDLDATLDPNEAGRNRETLRAGDAPKASADVHHLVSVFGSTERSGSGTVPDAVRMIALFGDTRLDLGEAQLDGRTIHISLLCLFGGIGISVPARANVSVEAISIFGGVSNRSLGSTDPDAPRIVISGLVLFGGAEVKVRKRSRKRFMELAASLREAVAPTIPPESPRR
jgi:hypothetical protein